MSFVFILTLGESDPFFNLSAEEYFLCEKDEDFFLLWQNEPCIVIGRNQNAADEINGDYVSTRSLPVVRRMTGGGAVYHDRGNLNFSFIINTHARLKSKASLFYESVPFLSHTRKYDTELFTLVLFFIEYDALPI